jgi:alkylation response protein AidB-like acyl-CoA dehydrogenase
LWPFPSCFSILTYPETGMAKSAPATVQSAAMSNTSTVDQVCEVLKKNAHAVDSAASWPEESVRAIAETGLWMPGNMREFTDTTRRFAQACTSSAMIYLMHVCAIQVIAASPDKRLLEKIKSERTLTTLAFSEKGSRSHFWAPVSRAHQNSRGIEINADKSFVTSAGRADYYVVSSGAISGTSVTESTLYLVKGGTAGVDVLGEWKGLGLRGNSSAAMKFNCSVDESSRLTNEGGGFKAMMEIVLPWFQVGSAAVSIGTAEAALSNAIQHVTAARLEHMGGSLAALVPEIRARLARMQLAVDASRGYLDQTLSRIEAQTPDAMLGVLGVKAFASENAIRVTDEAMRACGGAAFGAQLSVERHFRDARAASVMAPTTEILYDFIGKAISGLPLF